MEKVVSTKNLSHEKWLEYRKQGIGGSDAGAICGLNPYASPMSVYYDKTTENTDQVDNEAMRQGRDLENYVAQRFTEETGKKVRRSNVMYRSHEYPFMQANVDRLIVGEDAGLECKTVSPYSADKWSDGQIPAHYEIQCHHYMAVTGAKAWYIAAVIFGQGFVWRKIERDEDIIKNLIAIESDFWNNHVVPRIMPDPDGSAVCDEIIQKYFGRASRESIILTDEFNDKLKRRDELAALIRKLETEKNQIEQEVKLYMADYEKASNAAYRVSWTNVDTLRIDSKKLKSEQPEIYQRFTKSTSYRKFTVTAA